MTTYSNQEYADMHFIYGFCDGNAREASRVYQERYPNRDRFPDYRVFQRVHAAYREGRNPGAREGRPSIPDLGLEDEVLEMLRENPMTSVRRMSRRSGIPRSVVHRVVKRKRIHPFHVQRVQALLPTDHGPRMDFCREMLRRHRADPQFLNKILWSDETSFRRIGIFNMHNLHCYAYTNPHIVRSDHFQHQFGINMWAGIVEGQLIGPHELPARLNGPEYLRFLQNDLNGLLEEVSLETRRNMWLQQDGAPAHFARDVRNHINRTFPSRWIGRGGHIRWPPRSPDLNPIDFFLWGYYKEIVYETESATKEQLRQKITAATAYMKNNSRAFRRIKINFIRRCQLCLRMRGRNFEHIF